MTIEQSSGFCNEFVHISDCFMRSINCTLSGISVTGLYSKYFFSGSFCVYYALFWKKVRNWLHCGFQGLELFMGLSARPYILLAGFKCWMGNEVTGQRENDLSKLKLLE